MTSGGEQSVLGNFENKVVVVTGAAGGIGTEIAKLFAKKKAKLVLVDLDGNGLEVTADLCKKIENVEVLSIKADLTIEEELDSIVVKTLAHFAKIDVLVNNAGIGLQQTIPQTSWEDYDKVMNVNLKAPFFLIKGFLPELIKSKGTVVNTSSGAAKQAQSIIASYSLSKAGVDHLTRVAAQECGRFGVRVNSVNPSAVDTKLSGTDEHPSLVRLMAKVVQPLTRGLIKPEVIARWIVFLASEESGPITGQNISVDGGKSVTTIPLDYKFPDPR